MKTYYKLLTCLVILGFSILHITEVIAQCTNATYGLYPSSTFAPSCTGSFQSITTCGYCSEYSNVNVTSGNAYTFRSSVTTDYITIANGTSPLAFGVGGGTGISWTATYTGVARFYTHTSSACGAQTVCRTRSVSCTGGGGGGCTTAIYGLYPSSTFTPSCTGSFQTITTCGYASEYSNVNVISGTAYTFRSSVTTDYITIANGTTALTFGVGGATGISWTATYTGVARFYTHTNSSCGSQTVCRTRSVKCIGGGGGGPANDLICSATNITCGQTLAGTTVAATTTSETTLPFCTTTGGTAGGVWYKLTGFTAGQNITASLCGSSYDTKIHVYSSSTGTCSGTLSCVVGNDDFCGLQSQVAFTATAVPSLTYFIYVHGFSSATGTFSINVTCVTPAAANDNCSGALTLACGGTVTGTTVGATAETGVPACGSLTAGLWYTITPTANSNITLSLCGSSFDTYLSVYTGTCGALSCLTSNDDFCGLQSQLTFTGSAGVAYKILVSGYSGATGAFTLSASCIAITPPPSNDNCSGAISISCGNLVTGDNTYATNDAGFPACTGTGNNYRGVWYAITLPTSGTITATTCSYASWDTYLRIFLGTCGSLTCVANNDDACGLQSSVTTSPIAAGTYYILLSGYSSTAFGTYSLSVNCSLCSSAPSGGTVTGPASGCTGSTLSYSTAGASGSLQWQVSTTSVSGPFTDISGATTSSISYTPSASGTHYFIVSASGAGCTPGISNVFSTSVLSSGGVLTTSATPSSTACPGTTINLVGNFSTGSASLTITVGDLSYYLDETSYQIKNSSNVVIYNSGTLNSFTINTATVTPSASDYPVTFILETQGTFNDNTPDYSVVCNANSTTLVSGTMSGGSIFTSGPLSCSGASGSLTNPSWSGPGGFTSNSMSGSLPVTPTSGGVYTLTGLTPTGCQVSSTVTVNVNPAPQPLASSNAPICSGSSLSLFGDNLASGQTSGCSYSWTGPLGTYSGQNPNIGTASLSSGGTYTLMITNSFGCTASSSTSVVINPNPVLSAASVTNASCPGSSDACIDVDASNGVPLYVFDLDGNATLDGVYCGLPAGTYTAAVIDDNGCEATLPGITVTDLDLISPVITTAAINRVTQCDGAGNLADFNDWLITNWGDADATDNCSNVTYLDANWYNNYSAANWVTDCGTTKHVNVGFYVRDESGNNSAWTYATFYIVDTLPPVITFTPPAINANTDAGLCTSSTAIGTAIASDDCAGAGMTLTNDAPALFPVGNTLVTWTATDQCGNSSISAQTITVEDNENPVPNCAAAQIQTADFGDCGAHLVVSLPAPTDNCGILSAINNYNNSADASDHYAVGTTTVNWTITDIHGNTSTCAQNITVTDNENPAPNCAGAQTQTNDVGDCGANLVVLAPAPTDNCGILSALNSYNNSADASDHYTVGTTTVNWTITDIHGNTSTCAQNITVTDNENPTITCPVTYVANNDPGICGASLASINLPVTGDNCAVSTIVNNHPAAFFPVGITSVTWTVTDVHGNSSTCPQNVQVLDNEAPTVNCPADVIVYADQGYCYATNVALGNPVTGDNCGVSGSINNAPTQFPVGATIVDWETSDLSGNKANCQQFVIVIDNQNPVISGMPSNITFTADPTNCNPSVNWTAPTAADNCSVASFTSTSNSGDNFPEGTTTVTYTAIDINGNQTQASFTITILTQPLAVSISSPVFACGYNISCNGNNNGQAAATVGGGCLPYNVLWSNGATSLSNGSLTAGTYTLTVTDGNGHVTIQTITLTEPPALVTTLGPDQSYEFSCTCASLVSSTTGGSTCSPYVYAWSTGASTSSITVCPTQSATYSVTVTDINGCVTTDVIQVIKPAVVAQLDRYVLMGTGTGNVTVGNSCSFSNGSIGKRLAAGTLSIGNNTFCNISVAGNNVVVGNNVIISTLYRNTATIGSGAVISATVSPVTMPLTAKVPCFPVFSGGANVNVPNNTTMTISPGTYNNVTLGNNSILKLNAGVYNVNSISTFNGSFILPNGAATAKDIMVFVKTSMNVSNNNEIHGSYYSQGAVNLANGNNTTGSFFGAYFGNPVSVGNNLSFFLDSYCYSNLALCNVKIDGDETSIEAEAGTFNLFPNPNSGTFTIQYAGETGNDVKLTVLNTLGQVVYQRDVYEFSGEIIQDMDLSNLNPGIYFMQIINGNEQSNKQFVITY